MHGLCIGLNLTVVGCEGLYVHIVPHVKSFQKWGSMLHSWGFLLQDWGPYPKSEGPCPTLEGHCLTFECLAPQLRVSLTKAECGSYCRGILLQEWVSLLQERERVLLQDWGSYPTVSVKCLSHRNNQLYNNYCYVGVGTMQSHRWRCSDVHFVDYWNFKL